MRLEKIKLTGFKSFVEPTTVPLPSRLIGVVGPNGCGKSNVIDAVRWVMGESSAKMLRGESMADVIFNGSSGRKPLDSASIELVFDNRDGSVGGEYAQVAQIAVKRQVSRDGQSVYMLNGARCRRRDIQDLFLGTGLGPRSYSIIEQGMISRFIEAKPDELRLFIEEAAGISKYKERRRETETRMRHTRDNLDRLNDLRDEVAKQLKHLERQAANAEKYRTLKADEQRLEQTLIALRWRDLEHEIQARDQTYQTAATALETESAKLTAIDANIEQQRSAHSTANEQLNQVQQQFYALKAEISRTEQQLQFAREQRSRLDTELARIDQELVTATAHLTRDRERCTVLDADLAHKLPLLDQTREQLGTLDEQCAAAQMQLDDWQTRWEQSQADLAAPAQQAQVERTQMTHLEQRLEQDRQRQQRLEDELLRLDSAELQQRLATLDEQHQALDARLAEAEHSANAASAGVTALDSERRTLADALAASRQSLASAQGRQAALEALREAALDQDNSELGHWLETQGLTQAPRLLDLIEVSGGWETAVEIALAEALMGIVSADFADQAADVQCPGLTLLEQSPPTAPQASATLLEQVQAPVDLTSLLAPFVLADDRTSALARRYTLAPWQRLITRDGTLIGRNWLRTPPSTAAELAGSLARAEEGKQLAAQIGDHEQRIADLLDQQTQIEARYAEALLAQEQARNTISQLTRERATLATELSAGRAKLSQLDERGHAMQEELAELAERRLELTEQLEQMTERLHQALENSERLATRHDQLAEERERLRQVLATARHDEQQMREQVQQHQLAVETARTERASLSQALAHLDEQRTMLETRRAALVAELEHGAEPATEALERLETLLEQQQQVQTALDTAREQLDNIEHTTRDLEQQRQQLYQRCAQAQQTLETARLERQEQVVRQQTLVEELVATEQDPRALLEQVAAESTVDSCQQELKRTRERINRLGNINLAAIDEYNEHNERMSQLQSQHQDISNALNTLEAAIRKIDRETRSRFKDTFERVDAGLQQLFPQLFGGGQAQLALTSQDLLDAGVTIMARPPGKRNSSIHLLSGGEKALTAVALVFAIFGLNPAPFCLLDEVDAPLDDANVGRFCELVKQMSDRVQFIFITHNKLTMEIADHLIGVTMQEPGVSRLVAVDVDEAARLALS